MRAAAENSFARVLNLHGGAYIVIHRQTVYYLCVCVCVCVRVCVSDIVVSKFGDLNRG